MRVDKIVGWLLATTRVCHQAIRSVNPSVLPADWRFFPPVPSQFRPLNRLCPTPQCSQQGSSECLTFWQEPHSSRCVPQEGQVYGSSPPEESPRGKSCGPCGASSTEIDGDRYGSGTRRSGKGTARTPPGTAQPATRPWGKRSHESDRRASGPPTANSATMRIYLKYRVGKYSWTTSATFTKRRAADRQE